MVNVSCCRIFNYLYGAVARMPYSVSGNLLLLMHCSIQKRLYLHKGQALANAAACIRIFIRVNKNEFARFIFRH